MLSEERLRADVHRIANGIEVDTDAPLAAVLAETPKWRRKEREKVEWEPRPMWWRISPIGNGVCAIIR